MPDTVTAPVRPRDYAAGRIAFAAAPTALAGEAQARLTARYGDCEFAKAAVVVALGGDGSMLETLHRVLGRDVPVYGMNCGSVGFLMNTFSEEDFPGPPGARAGGGAAPAADARGDGEWQGGGGAGAQRGRRCCANCARRRRSVSRWMGGCG